MIPHNITNPQQTMNQTANTSDYMNMTEQEKEAVNALLDAEIREHASMTRALSMAILLSIVLIVAACLIVVAASN
jgi:hypothetical protein